MKIIFKGGGITAIPEDEKDLAVLMGYVRAGTPVQRKHKKHRHRKLCPQCGRDFKGLHGLAMHKVRSHSGRNWSGKRKQNDQSTLG